MSRAFLMKKFQGLPLKPHLQIEIFIKSGKGIVAGTCFFQIDHCLPGKAPGYAFVR